MLRYGFKNLRRLLSVDPIEIRPITLLVGRNSSGKSTFLRTIPLFRQSINTKTSSPLLWYGELVDFGSYEVSVSAHDTSKPIVLSFEVDDLIVSSRRNQYIWGPSNQRYRFKDCAMEISIVPIEKRTRISSVKLDLRGASTVVELFFDEHNVLENLFMNGRATEIDLKKFSFSLNSGALFPDLFLTSKPADLSDQVGLFHMGVEESALEDEAFKIIRPHLDNRIAAKTLRSFITTIFSNPIVTNERLRTISTGLSARFRSFVREMAGGDEYKLTRRISELVLAYHLANIVSSFSLNLRNIFRSTLYIGPARARSERYYRYQDLSVSEIDPDGKNFPMFLNSLSRMQITSLSNWIRDLFGYGIRISQETGHISIELVEHDSTPNVIDVGYGVSQILPVLGQIWWARARPTTELNNVSMTLLAIEQPELHLHPAHQALLADAIVGETLVSSDDPQKKFGRANFVIETHSETLVNRLGELISRKKISSNDVQILLFETTKDDEYTKVRSVNYDADGVLVDWPVGFFEPETL